ncbi:MAG: hypothetical protein ABR597_11230 [Bacteroidales bacterium]
MGVEYYIIGIYALALLGAIVGIIYLIFRRIKVKKGETFERRKN